MVAGSYFGGSELAISGPKYCATLALANHNLLGRQLVQAIYNNIYFFFECQDYWLRFDFIVGKILLLFDIITS